LLPVLAACVLAVPAARADAESPAGYDALLRLFAEWRDFEHPPIRDGAPDYSVSTITRRQEELQTFRDRLEAIDTSAWPVEARVDQALVRAEMNGFDFYARVPRKPYNGMQPRAGSGVGS